LNKINIQENWQGGRAAKKGALQTFNPPPARYEGYIRAL
jgi:hypothetical protein